jgi:hypothetical protein
MRWEMIELGSMWLFSTRFRRGQTDNEIVLTRGMFMCERKTDALEALVTTASISAISHFRKDLRTGVLGVRMQILRPAFIWPGYDNLTWSGFMAADSNLRAFIVGAARDALVGWLTAS